MDTNKKFALLLATFLLCLGLPRANAQTAIDLGPRVGYEIDDLTETFIGADLRIDPVSMPVIINPTFDYFIIEGDGSVYQLGVNALYPFGVNNQTFTPYVGLGVVLTRMNAGTVDDSNAGLNVLGGATFGLGNIKPFIQGQVTFGDLDFVSVAGGLLFSLNR